MDRPTVGFYAHIPFCVRKCAYCDFNSHSGYTAESVARYAAALACEIRQTGASVPASPGTCPIVDTVFFGGGTPTVLPASTHAALLQTIKDSFPLSADAEITTEANPGTLDTARLDTLRDAGFNRISFGVQSFDAGLLKTLGRIHSSQDAVQAVQKARAAGFDNVSVDLMFALPGQSLTQWRDTLEQALALQTEHVSLYALMVEPGTGFYTLQQKGRLPLPDDDLAAEMYALAGSAMRGAGLAQYEISNFARPHCECRHNLHYWRNDPYYGVGCGAVAYQNGARRMNIKPPGAYAEAVETGQTRVLSEETLAPTEQMAETMMLGLRLTSEGVNCERFAQRHGIDPRTCYRNEIAKWTNRGLLEVTDCAIRLTPAGIFLSSEVMMDFV